MEDLTDVYNDIIMEHSMNSYNKKRLEKCDFCEKGHNPNCGDEIELQVKMNGDIIEDIAECNCKDCTKGYEGCKIYKVLDEALIDKPGIEINCPYAWNSKE